MNITTMIDGIGEIISSEESAVHDVLPKHIEFLSFGGHLAVGIVLSLTSSGGVFFNGAILYTFAKNSHLWTTTHCLILCLVISDFIMALFGTPMVAISSFYTRWVFGYPGCQFYAFLMSFLGYITIYILTIISVARFIITVRTAWKPYLSRNMLVISMVCACIYCFLWAIFPFLGWNSYELEGADTSCSVNWRVSDIRNASYCVAIMLVHLYLPFGVMVVCYGKIFYQIKHHSLRGQRRLTRRNWCRRMEMDRKITMTIFLMIAAFMLSWFPYSVVCMWSLFGNSKQIPVHIAIVPTILAKISVLWNPMIYIVRSNTLRTALQNTLPCLSCSNRPIRSSIEIVQRDIDLGDRIPSSLDNPNNSSPCYIKEADRNNCTPPAGLIMSIYSQNVSLREQENEDHSENIRICRSNDDKIQDKSCQTQEMTSSSTSGRSEYYSVTSGDQTKTSTKV